MLRLYILRHAKSSWADAGIRDFDRPLNPRGAADLPKLASRMKEKEYLPDFVYCSPALRTRVTLHGIMHAYAEPPKIEYVERLYSGGAESYVNCLRTHDTAQPVMFVGHNPSVSELAQLLVADGDGDAMARIAEKFPTGALAVIQFEIDSWDQLAPASGELVDFIAPRDL